LNNGDPERGTYSRKNIMGKPIQKKWFGVPNDAGYQIVVDGVKFADGTTSSSAYIVKQVGSTAYIVQDVALTHAQEIVFMVNATSTGSLSAGECYILATPFEGAARPCAKISQFRVTLYEADGTTGSYTWSTRLPTSKGQAILVKETGTAGQILSINVSNAGKGYFTAPTITFNGAGGSNAAATAIIADGSVIDTVITNRGASYATGVITFAAPPASVTATGSTATLDGGLTGVVTAVSTPSTPGGYYVTAPLVSFTVSGSSTPATAHAVVVDGTVTSVIVDTPGVGYTSVPTVSFAAPPAAVTALGAATIST